MSQRVLIVDDEPDVVKYLSTALSVNGYEVDVTDNVKEGLQKVSDFAPDLICLDVMMPEESGISMYLRLKQESTTADIPVVMISGVAQESQFDFRGYVDDESVPPPECFLEKPVDVDRLLETVKALIPSPESGASRKADHG